MTTKTISSTEARKTFYGLMREVVDDAVPIVVRNRGRENVVMMPESEFNALQETLYLLSGHNGEHLRESEEQLRRGETTPVTLAEIERMLAE